MRVTLNLHKTHRQYTGGIETLELEGNTIGDCIDRLIERFSGMREALFDGKGKLKNQIEIYLNMESAYPDELKKPVKDGDDVYITVMLAGG
ncbi:putative ThiS family protein [Desulfosarcina cetonica]|uniref:MoaD/ThiS family protein n=1 Tax=Desulfosarcina cetonica TaxID=90730 RepID=UPI0006D0F82F|nr:MoaD/ThiS family protein [Desulfosarcina cetonica]VTR71203.1 putative ThiS family protein [Desulfosarcina cetonica]